MSLKQAIRKRNLKKNGLNMESMVFAEVATKVEDLVMAEYKAKLRLLGEKADDIADKLTFLGEKLTKETTHSADTEKEQLVQFVKDSTFEMRAIRASLAKEMSDMSSVMVEDAKTQIENLFSDASGRIDQLLADIDKKVGPKGDPGKDGSPDTAKDIAKKLNTTTDSVNLAVIKGLTDRLDQLTKLAKRGGGKSGGGGGTGQPQHESKNVSSATTTVTTTYPIAAGGRFVFLFYQGQNLAYDTHYTVGADNRTITLTFTPDDATIIDITYIRGS